MQLHDTLYVQFQCILRGPNNESTQMVYLCVARQTHHLTVPTVPYFMSRTNLSVHSLTSKSLCACLCMSVSLAPRPHPAHVRRRGLVLQARILGLVEVLKPCDCWCRTTNSSVLNNNIVLSSAIEVLVLAFVITINTALWFHW